MKHEEYNEDLLRSSQRARRKRVTRKVILCVAAYLIAAIYFFPIFYMFLTGMKTEMDAIDPKLIFTPSFDTFKKIFEDAAMYGYLKNSGFQVLFSVLLCLVLGLPAAFAIQFGKFKKRTTNSSIHLWFVTTILLPPVAILVPLYLFYNKVGLLKVNWGLTILYVGFHLPIVIWMLCSFLGDIPETVIEAAELDGCTRIQQIAYIAVPLVKTGLFTAGMLVAVFIWNEFFLSYSLADISRQTLPVYMSRFRETQGQNTAHLCAAATITVLPALIVGWMTQKSLVKGLTNGAVKG